MKLRLALAATALAAVGLLGLTACLPGSGTVGAQQGASLTPEQTALTELGFTQDDVVGDTPADDPSASPAPAGGNGHPRLKRLAVRRALARNVEHGQVVVDTKDGEKTIDVQRGTVTAITDTTITVKCTDGFSETWTFGTPLHVIEHRTTVQPKDLAAGDTVGVAGAEVGGTVTANLIVIPNA